MSLEHSPARQAGRAVFTVAEFCDSHRVSRSKLYQLWKDGTGPKIIRIGTKVLISVEAATDWRREREREAAEQSA